MQAVADALSLMANIVMAWNTSQMQAVLIAGRTAARSFHRN
jgi:TnpA family transposase